MRNCPRFGDSRSAFRIASVSFVQSGPMIVSKEARYDRQYQFSTFRPGTRVKCLTLLVTIVTSSESA